MYAEGTPTTAMSTQPSQSTGPRAAPTATGWDLQRDEAFFRLTAALFPPAFTSGAGVLLASYDED